ncbi:MAG: hypothetical protein NZ853_07490 [Leptospiraceae bacterium]|nr:hypothetical protein [Leptospiraceae bacterium]MDW7975722.1 hypothetical protein [Leptospiraceae bacterium]
MKRKKFIGLKYEPDVDVAPRICFKIHTSNSDFFVKVLENYKIPLIKDEILTSILDKIPLNWEIPKELYFTIAKIYGILYKDGYLKKKSNQN